MKHKLLKSLLLLSALVVGSSSVWAGDITLTATSGFSSSYGSDHTFTVSSIGFKDDGVAYNAKGTPNGWAVKQLIQLRKSGSGAGTIYNTSAINTITSVEVTLVTANNDFTLYYGTSESPSTNSIASSSLTPTTGTFSYTNTSDNTASATSYKFTFDLSSYNATFIKIVNGSKANYVGSIKINYSATSTPSISANNVDIAYNATSGSIAYSLVNATGTVTAATTSDWLTLGTATASAVPFTCSANTSATARTAKVTLSFTDATDKVVTITQAGNPDALNNISDITASGTAYKVKGTVVATNARGFVIGDGTGYVYYYKGEAPTQAVNDKVKIAGTTSDYGHVVQFPSDATITTETTSAYNGSPAATVITTVPDYSTGLHLSTYLQFEGSLSKSSSNYYIILGESQIQISYPTTDQGTALDALDGKTVRVKGYFTGINSSSKFSVMLESVEGVPVITASSASLAVPDYEFGTANPIFGELTVNGSSLTDNITLTLDENSNFEMATGSTWSNSLILSQANGSVNNMKVYIRLKAGLSKGNYEGAVTLSSTGATNVVVNLSGSVTGQTYVIHLESGNPGGSIEASSTSAEEGATVTLTPKPNDAYTFGSWEVIKEDGTAAVINVTNNQFTMPACNVLVTAKFNKKTTYAVTCVADPAAGGTIGTTTATAYQGQTVTLNYTVESGYWLSDIVITKTSDGSATNIIPAKGTGSTYTFDMPDYAVTATAKFVETYASGTFAKYSDNITEGYYVITSTTYAMKNTVSSNRFANGTFTATNNMITNPSVEIVWYIKPNGSYWTIFNVDAAKFAAGTDTKNQGAMIDGVTDLAKWTVTQSSGTFQFENYGRSQASSDSGNKWLRNNGDNGWACYASSTGGALTLYKLTNLVERTITFNGNGGTYNTATTYTQTVYDGVEATLDANKFAYDGYEFVAWNNQADGNGASSYYDGDKITVTGSDLTLYAQWAPLYTLTIDNGIQGGSVEVEGNITSSVEGVDITLKATPSTGNKFTAWNVYKAGDSNTKVTVTNNVFNMPAYNVVISATFSEAQTYSLVTNVNQIVSGKHYIIASGADGSVKAMGTQNTNYRNVVAVTATNGIISEPTGASEFVIYGPDVNGNYTIYDANYGTEGGSLYASNSDQNYLKTQAANDANGTWNISIESTGAATINAQGSNSRNRMRFNGDRFACYASNTTVSALPYIYVKDGEALPSSVVVRLAASGYASYCAPFPLDLTPTTNYAAYAVTATSGATVTFSKINGAVPAGTPFILYGENYKGQDATLNVATGATTAVSGNMLKGTFVPTAVTTTTGTGANEYTNFALSGGSFKKITSGTVSANKAYLPVLTANVPTTSVKEFSIIFEDDATPDGIVSPLGETEEGAGAIYNLAGQRLQKMQKGINIVNGKKILK